MYIHPSSFPGIAKQRMECMGELQAEPGSKLPQKNSTGTRCIGNVLLVIQ